MCRADACCGAPGLQETGTDPITGEPLSLEDLVAVKSNKVLSHLRVARCPNSAQFATWLVHRAVVLATQAAKPRTSPATSIPGLLGLFHNVRRPALASCLYACSSST